MQNISLSLSEKVALFRYIQRAGKVYATSLNSFEGQERLEYNHFLETVWNLADKIKDVNEAGAWFEQEEVLLIIRCLSTVLMSSLRNFEDYLFVSKDETGRIQAVFNLLVTHTEDIRRVFNEVAMESRIKIKKEN